MQRQDFDTWFGAVHLGNLDGGKCHLRLKQRASQGWMPLLPQLTEFLERAHRDAKQYFEETIGVSLDPLGSSPVHYPQSLPLKTLKGYFGEAFCGLVAELVEVVGRRRWSVPVFMFRCHQHAADYLERLITGEQLKPDLVGRPGSDFIALMLSNVGAIEAFLVGEAKCHKRLSVTEARDALLNLNRGKAVPVSLRQLKVILREVDSVGFATTIRSIEQIQLQAATCTLPRTDLLVYIFEEPGVVSYSAPRISPTEMATHHTCGRDIHVVEVHIPDVTALVQTAYNGLFRTPPPTPIIHAAA